MKQILLICAVVGLVGCGESKEEEASKEPEPPKAINVTIANPIIEEEIRRCLRKPTGELTKADLEEVDYVWLRDNQLTDVKDLEKLAQLNGLELVRNQLTEFPSGLEKLTRLETLDLRINKLTNVQGLEKLTQLEELLLSHNQLSNLKGLEKLTQLWRLWLNGNQLTDVKSLEKLTKLKELYLKGNPALTKAQIDQLQKALPNCKISSNPTK